MINTKVVTVLNKLYKDCELDKADVLSITLNDHGYFPYKITKNQIHVYGYGFKGCNVAVMPHSKEYMRKSTYKIYDNELFEIFSLKSYK